MAGITLSELLKKMIELGGSDLHLSTNSAPRVRVHGKLRPLDMPPLTAADTKALAYSVLTDAQKHRLRGKSGTGLLVRLEESGTLPRQHLPSARRRGGRLPYDSVGNQEFRRARSSRSRSRAVRQAARTGAGHRADRIGQVHHARRDARQDQQRTRRAHDHDRGPDRVSAQPQEVPGQPARSSLGYAFVREFAARRSCAKTPTWC